MNCRFIVFVFGLHSAGWNEPFAFQATATQTLYDDTNAKRLLSFISFSVGLFAVFTSQLLLNQTTLWSFGCCAAFAPSNRLNLTQKNKPEMIFYTTEVQ